MLGLPAKKELLDKGNRVFGSPHYFTYVRKKGK